MNRIFPFKSNRIIEKKYWYDNIGISYNLNAKNQLSSTDSLLFHKSTLHSFKNGMRHNIPISTSIRVLKYFNLTPSLNFTERWYMNQIEKTWNENDSTVTTDTIHKFTRGHNYNFSTGLNTKIYGLVKFKKHKINIISTGSTAEQIKKLGFESLSFLKYIFFYWIRGVYIYIC